MPLLRQDTLDVHRIIHGCMRIIGREAQHIFNSIYHTEHVVQPLAIGSFLEGLRAEEHVLADVLTRKPPHPWRFSLQEFELAVEAPHESRKPRQTILGYHHSQVRILLEYAMHHHA